MVDQEGSQVWARSSDGGVKLSYMGPGGWGEDTAGSEHVVSVPALQVQDIVLFFCF